MGLRPGHKLEFDKESESKNYHSDYYKGGENYNLRDLSRDLPRIMDEPDIKAVQIILEITDPETGHTTLVSKVIDPEMYFENEDIYDSMDEYIEEEIFSMEQYKGYKGTPGGVSIRVMK